jgi:hypothetical protein
MFRNTSTYGGEGLWGGASKVLPAPVDEKSNGIHEMNGVEKYACEERHHLTWSGRLMMYTYIRGAMACHVHVG